MQPISYGRTGDYFLTLSMVMTGLCCVFGGWWNLLFTIPAVILAGSVRTTILGMHVYCVVLYVHHLALDPNSLQTLPACIIDYLCMHAGQVRRLTWKDDLCPTKKLHCIGFECAGRVTVHRWSRNHYWFLVRWSLTWQQQLLLQLRLL